MVILTPMNLIGDLAGAEGLGYVSDGDTSEEQGHEEEEHRAVPRGPALCTGMVCEFYKVFIADSLTSNCYLKR